MKGKRVISLFLALVLVIGMVSLSPPSAYAAGTDGFGFNTDPPDGYDANDGKNPYGQGRVALNPEREILVMGAGLTPAVYDANDPVNNNRTAAVTNWQDVIERELAQGNTTKEKYFLAGLKMVAYDPNGTGKDDHVACIGLVGKDATLSYTYHTVKVWVFNAKTGQQEGNAVTLVEGAPVMRGGKYGPFNRGDIVYETAASLLTIAAGDMDGDGRDELYAYRPGTYQSDDTSISKENGAIVKISDKSSEYIGLPDAPAGTVVGLALGDADGDSRDELAHTIPTSGRKNLSVYLYGDKSGSPDKEWAETVYDDKYATTYRASLAFGNLNGDNKEDLAVAFSVDGDVCLAAYLFKDGDQKLTATPLYRFVSYDASEEAPPVVACFARRGMSNPDYIFVDGASYYVEGKKLYEGQSYLSDSSISFYRGDPWFHSAVAGNFDGNDQGIEEVLYSYSRNDRSEVRVASYDGYWDNTWHDSQTGLRLDRADFPTYARVPFLALAAPDVDDDTMFIEFRSKEYTFDNPKIISILQASPYFEDLSDYYYDGTGGTSFGTSSGSGGGSTQSTSVNAHATLKVGVEFGFIVTVAAYVETTATTEWSSEYSVMETTTLATQFNGGKQENNVVLLGIPVTQYTYDVYAPNGKGGYEKDQMVISIPGDPQYSVITVEQYNAAARAGGLSTISDSQVHATPGDPASYYQGGSGEMRGLKNLVTYKGDDISVGGSGTATTTRSITRDTEYSITDTFTYDIDINAGMEAAGSGFSLGGGFGESNSSVQVTTTGVTREVEVANVPAQGQGRYGFQWNMAIWDTQVGNQTVPVVGYVTRNVKQPPALPGAFTVTETTTDSVKLGWEPSSTASSYEIYQYFKDSSTNQYVRVAALDGDVTEYTVSGLRSGGTYEYVICSLDATGQRSVYSAPVTAVTLPGDGQSPTIQQSPQNANVRPGANASFQVSAQPAPNTSGLSYAWYESAKGGSVWNPVGGSSSTLTLSQVDTKKDGSRYRCVVSQVIGGQQVLVYSDVATLHVGQGETTTMLAMNKNSGKAGYSVETKTQEQVTVPKTREITVGAGETATTASYVEYNATGNPTTIYRANDGTYYVLTNVKLNDDGKTGTADAAVKLSQKPSEFTADEGVTIPEGVTPDSLTGSEQGVFTIPSGSAATGTTAGDYYVYTAEITETGEDGTQTTVTRTVYAKESENQNPTTYYTLSQEITEEGENTKTTYTMTKVTQTIKNVEAVMVAGTLIVKGAEGTGEIVTNIPDNPGEDTYTTYAVYSAGSGKVYQADGVYYLLTFDTTDENKVTARAALTVETYDTLEGESYTDITAGEAVTETVTQNIITMTPQSGDSVTLTASVTESAGTANPDGTVTFRITNTDTGVSKNQTVTLSNGKATLNWTPDAPGVYSITASYNGDSSFLTSASAVGTYYAIADGGTEFTSLVLRPDQTSVEYGDTVNLKLYEAKTEGGTVTEKESTAANVTYTVRVENPDYNSSEPESETNKKYQEEEISAAWTANKVPGSYVFTATTQEGKSASAAVTVTRRALEAAVPDEEVSMGTVPSASDLTFRRAGTEDTNAWANGENYTGLFTVSTALTATSGSGVYQVTPVMVSSPNTTDLAAFNSRYTWTPVSGQWTVQANTHNVTLTAGVNGEVVGHVGDRYEQLTGTVKHGEQLSFTATPAPGFEVNGWTINGDPVTENTQGVTLSADKTKLTVASLTEDLTVNVTFSNQSHTVNFGVDQAGGGKVTATNGGKEISPGGRVTGGTGVTFTATPDPGKIVKSWTVNGIVQKNEDDSNFVGNELTLDNISQDTNVVVAFEDAVSYTVTFSAVNTKGEPAQSGAVTLDSEGLNGQNQAVKGSKVVLKATPGPGSAILEWQEYDGQKWNTLAGSQGSFTISNLQGDRNIRVKINESVTTHKLTFEVVDMDGAAVTDAGTLTAKIGSDTVESGGDFLTSSKVDFSFTPTQSYEVAEWRVNGISVQEGLDKLTYTIDSLLGNTTVQVAVHKKPQVTVSNTETTKGGVTVEGFVNGKKQEITSGGYADYGTDLTVTLKPKVGYEVADATGMTAVANSDDRYYTISRVTEDQTVTPVWAEIPKVPLTFSVVDKKPDEDGGTDGSITAVVTRKGLSGYAQSVETSGAEAQTIYAYRDSVVTFISNPDAGYTIGTRKLDGNVQRQQIVLSITAEHKEHKVEIQFDAIGDAITFGFDRDETTNLAAMSASFTASGGNQAETFESGNKASADGSITFTVSKLNAEYQIQGWYLNGVEQEATGDTYTMAVKANEGAIVRVKLVPVQYTVTFSSDQGSVTAKAVEFESDAGEITIGSGRKLNSGSQVTFTAPDVEGYNFTGWTVNGQPSDEQSQTLTINPLRADTQVKANYEMIIVNYAVTYGAQDGNGTLTAAVGGTDVGASPAQVRSGSRVVFTAAPGSGYQVKGWYSDASCTQPIAGTQAEQKTYSINDLTGDVSVYVAFEPVPAYEITVDITGTKQGAVTAAVNGKAAAISGGKLTVSRHDNVTLSATPNENQRLVAWTLDNVNKGNSSMVLNLTDVTAAHAVTAEFGSTQSVTLTVKAEGGNGSVTTQLGYGDDLQTVGATNGYRADVGQTVKVTASPATNFMVKSWTVDGVVQDNLSNTLTIDSLTKNTAIAVEYEALALYNIPASGSGYTIADVTKTPTDYGDASHIRGRGTVSFTVKPEEGQYLTELKINGVDCLTGHSSGDLTVTPNGDGSYAVTVKNVKENIPLTAASMQFKTEQGLLTTVPGALSGTYQSVDALQSALRAKVQEVSGNVPNNQTALLDIKLQYTEDDGKTWQDATPKNFPKGGIRVSLPYCDLGNTDSSYDFTVIHMFTTDMNNHKVGATEKITPTKDNDGIHFTVTSLSPFAVGWTKTTTPVGPDNPGGGGGGGGGGGIVADSFDIIVDTDQNGTVTPSKKNAAEGDTVTLTAVPKEGYALSSLTVTDAKGGAVKLTEQDGKYSFTMPASKVTVKAVFAGSGKPAGNPFTDVKDGDFFHDAVQWAVERGITTGTSATAFSPGDGCTRAQIVTFLWRSAGSPEPASGTMPFADVDEGSYYEKAVQWAVEKGIATGTSLTTFSPDEVCTRGQSVTFLYRAAGAPEISGGIAFNDVEASDYYAAAVSWAEKNGIASGVGDGRFGPASDCTRAQIVTFLYRWQTK